MHSLKNTFVAVLLLAVSYGVYEVITTPDPSVDQNTASVVDPNATPDDFKKQTEPDFSWPDQQKKMAPPAQSPVTPSPPSNLMTDRSPPAAPIDSNPDNSLTNRDDQGYIDSLKDDLNVQGASAASTDSAPLIPGQVRNAGGSFTGTESQVQPLGNVAIMRSTPPAIQVLTESQINSVWQQVDGYINEMRFRAALGALSQLYGQPSFTGIKQQKLTSWLDALAAKVIYSTENNLFDKPYLVQAGDSLDSIAQHWGIPPQLIYNINRSKIIDPQNLQPRNELKMLKGPFRAEISISNSTLTLFLNNLYAGRFDCTIPDGLRPMQTRVTQKLQNGLPILHLDGDISIANEKGQSQAGCIRLSEKDTNDVFSILSNNSSIIIRQ